MQKLVLSSILVSAMLFAVGVTAEAQQRKKVPPIGYLAADDFDRVFAALNKQRPDGF
jgi:hypothetical protein